MSQHKIGRIIKKKKKKKKQEKQPFVSHGENINTHQHKFHLTQTSQATPSLLPSLPHLSIFLLFFYASDVQNIIAPARVEAQVRKKQAFRFICDFLSCFLRNRSWFVGDVFLFLSLF